MSHRVRHKPGAPGFGAEVLGRDKGDLYEAVTSRMMTIRRNRNATATAKAIAIAKMLTENSAETAKAKLKNLAPIPKIR